MQALHKRVASSHPVHHSSNAFCSSSRPPCRHHARGQPLRANPEGAPGQKTSAGNGLDESMLARLRAAEEEAAALKQQLAQMQAQAGPAKADEIIETAPQRINSTDNRETLFSSGKRNSWLSEADVDFFTGGGSSESSAGSSGPTPEQQSAIQRRLLIGGLAALGLGAFALVPTQALRPKPSKPLYFYLLALLGTQEQLKQCQEIIEDARWNDLRIILPRIKSAPGNVRNNMYDAVALLSDSATATKAEELVGLFLEDLDGVDYNKYFDAMPTRQISGTQNAEFVKFSGAALRSAQQRLAAFLALMPREQLDTAKQQLLAQSQYTLE